MAKKPPTAEDPLTLEDVALLADGADSLPHSTKQRLRRLVLNDRRFRRHLKRLEALAQEAGINDSQDRLGAALLVHSHYRQLAQAKGWQHPAEVLDPDGTVGIHYVELLHIARARAETANGAGRPQEILRQIETAWAAEKRRSDFASGVAEQLADFDPSEAEQLLRRIGHELRWKLKQQHRARTAGL